jgi:hypothetical protein
MSGQVFIQNSNFTNENQLAGRFDRLAHQFLIQNSKSKIWWMETDKPTGFND